MNLSPAFVNSGPDLPAGLSLGDPAVLLSLSPLHLLFAGTEAVVVFFVLSGLVLTGPAWRRDGRLALAPYYAKRLPRLYLPTIAGVLLAVVVLSAVDRSPVPGSVWINGASGPITAGDVVGDALLVNEGETNRVLWSLQLEVLFSLLLPVALRILWALRRRRVLVAVVLVGASLVGVVAGWRLLAWMPMFGFGMLLAASGPELEAAARWLDERRAWWLVLVATLLLLTFRWWTRGVALELAPSLVPRLWNVGLFPIALGATLAVFVAHHHARTAALLGRRPVQFLGMISFSLYLVHEPIVVAGGFLAGRFHLGAVLVTLVVALVVAVVFHRLVERPSQRVAAWSAEAVTRLRAPAATLDGR